MMMVMVGNQFLKEQLEQLSVKEDMLALSHRKNHLQYDLLD